jgi:translation elongation factor EF-G
MLILAKVALGLGATLAMTTAYVFHEGVIRVDVDEHRLGGSHVHFWVPATTVSAGMRLASLVPQRPLEQAARQMKPHLPMFRVMAKELQKYPNAEFLDVTDEEQHVHIATVNGKLRIDVVGDDQTVHLQVPVETLLDIVDRFEEAARNAPTEEWHTRHAKHSVVFANE